MDDFLNIACQAKKKWDEGLQLKNSVETNFTMSEYFDKEKD